MTVRFTQQGCKVETTCVIQPNGTYTEYVQLSVDPAHHLALAVEESAGQSVGIRADLAKWKEVPPRLSSRIRATKHGFELVPERRP